MNGPFRRSIESETRYWFEEDTSDHAVASTMIIARRSLMHRPTDDILDCTWAYGAALVKELGRGGRAGGRGVRNQHGKREEVLGSTGSALLDIGW